MFSEPFHMYSINFFYRPLLISFITFPPFICVSGASYFTHPYASHSLLDNIHLPFIPSPITFLLRTVGDGYKPPFSS